MPTIEEDDAVQPASTSAERVMSKPDRLSDRGPIASS